ncbi:uncharacterized protein PHACADRAFT_264849 [Phanerochaete carnosa HHB-10118-sp]|uniref:F-box domain-containing protein n=1 Tax=Phanerochaete carnosa (strain HHB-10118-sp) TaxID=650164 RepID=K5VG89_PHACS|nr:uncharacterized protein PHACADRAFT_264849 [Phanerochaete carnosa HHB-10118-sp]EKM50233.1 hypothetical protein PHACADRAFT_264849 [Phanerochaete carnosa HHB-10118-sp]
MGNGHSVASEMPTLHFDREFNVQLPEEVIGHIVASLSEEAITAEPGYKNHLASCALTCHSWHKYLHPYLFTSLTLRTHADLDVLLQLIDSDERIRTRLTRLDLHETDECWIHHALHILPSQLPAVTSLGLHSPNLLDASDPNCTSDALRVLCADLPQIRNLELGGSAFDDFPTFSACVSAFPSLTQAQYRGVTWTRPSGGARASERTNPAVEVDTVSGGVPWLWTLASPFPGEDTPVLADADAAVFTRLVEVAMYNSAKCTVSLKSPDSPRGQQWEVIVRCATGNSAVVSIAPDMSRQVKGTPISTIRSASLRLTPAGSTVNDEAHEWIQHMAQLDASCNALPQAVSLALDWEYVGTVEWYVMQDLKHTLFRRLWAAKRLVYHLTKGTEPRRALYLPMALRHK